MVNSAWDMLRAMASPDKKGRYKTSDAMRVAKVLYAENQELKRNVEALFQIIEKMKAND